jgi:hypothetical protein
VTAIKPPGGSGGIHAPQGADPASESKPVEGPSFAERAEKAAEAKPSGSPTSVAEVISQLKAGTLHPQKAVEHLVQLTMDNSHTPAAFRPAVEAQIRSLLSSDPHVRDLLQAMGAVPPPEK